MFDFRLLFITIFNAIYIKDAMRLTQIHNAHFNITKLVDIETRATGHPMLYFTSEAIAGFRHKADTTHAHIAQDLRQAKTDILKARKRTMPPEDHAKFTSFWNEIYGNNLPPLAMYLLIYLDDLEVFNFIQDAMDRLTAYPDWLVQAMPVDEVPISHTLLGYATTFDFLYTMFDEQRQIAYLDKIITTTQYMYAKSFKRFWGRSYIQNHVASNMVALLTGAIVASVHTQDAYVWIERTLNLLEGNMYLLSLIGDGSLNEGVAYGAYTMRTITQYLYLVQHHYHIDHSQNEWLKEHFWFYFSTLLPGFKENLAVGDSNKNWWYGPESQLIYLDSYVLRNGWGNWLADKIREARKYGLSPGVNQRWTTHYTEFLWYDPTIKPTPPPGYTTPSLHVFKDWGVVTYGGGQELLPGATFLSFKSSKLHGRVVKTLTAKHHNGLTWDEFNPGHEHPDQNSFVFAPNGKLLITDGLYSFKWSHTNNIMMFSPSTLSNCSKPWVGQIHDCNTWLEWHPKKGVTEWMDADIVYVGETNNMVYIVGEAAKAYPAELMLNSVARHLLLLSNQLLLILDHIEINTGCSLTHWSSYFNNYQNKFLPLVDTQFKGAKMITDNEEYRLIVKVPGTANQPEIRITEIQTNQGKNIKRTLSNVNISSTLQGRFTDVLYILHSPEVIIQDVKFLSTTDVENDIYLKVNNIVNLVSMKHHKTDSDGGCIVTKPLTSEKTIFSNQYDRTFDINQLIRKHPPIGYAAKNTDHDTGEKTDEYDFYDENGIPQFAKRDAIIDVENRIGNPSKNPDFQELLFDFTSSQNLSNFMILNGIVFLIILLLFKNIRSVSRLLLRKRRLVKTIFK